MPEVLNVAALAARYVAMFSTKSRANGETFLTHEGDTDSPLADLVREAHGDMMPDDTRYQMVFDALSTIADNPEHGDIRELLDEQEPPVYTSDLLRWLSSHNDRLSLCDEAASDGMVDRNADMTARIMAGWCYEWRIVAHSVLESLETQSGFDA